MGNIVQSLASLREALKPTAVTSPGSLLERQSLKPHLRPTESESAFSLDPQVMHMPLKVEEALK